MVLVYLPTKLGDSQGGTIYPPTRLSDFVRATVGKYASTMEHMGKQRAMNNVQATVYYDMFTVFSLSIYMIFKAFK